MGNEILADFTPRASARRAIVVGSHVPERVKMGDDDGELLLIETHDLGWCISHVCDRRAKNRGVVRCAPRLSDGHQIAAAGTVTVHPSILCVDCGLHGYITESTWRPA